MIIKICGIPHEVVECESKFDNQLQMGMIDHEKCVIYINKALSVEVKKETLCHEIVHGILVHIGYNDLTENEQFVQAMGNAIYQIFEVRE